MRDTLSWLTCDVCHRRLATQTCRVDGRVLRLCPYCMAALVPNVISCGQQIQRPRPSKRRSELDEDLIGSLREEAEGQRRRATRRGHAE